MADTGIAGWIETHPALSIGAVVVGGLLLVGIVQSKKQTPAATTTPTQATGDLSGLQTDANGNHILYRVASDTYINTSIFEDSYNSTVDSHNQSNSNNTTTTTVNPPPPPPDTTPPPPPPPTQTPPNNTITWTKYYSGPDFGWRWRSSLMPPTMLGVDDTRYAPDSQGIMRDRVIGAVVSPGNGAVMSGTDWNTPAYVAWPEYYQR